MQQRLDAPDEHTRNKEEAISEPEAQPQPEAPQKGVTRLPGIAAQLIGERMRTMYASMVREPVPDELLKLVRQLESKEESE
ncbi:hypothetical protein HYPDE_29703 [Hyphomicrobium denitrificans 1NES1]|uniref:Anti-sigma factor NepR domain-containing protein n=1 Tax=Hyphomicrobium denitrificans 1NES1 TaxID=670307 RepID=N0BBW2_9HYPH|nr:NepR family anti-sigma factor [Hyphomicrobium denitrificans]AGK57615.1 hypothetical protein HYPDE_29703 [Hyphomicrobium denitrificans 1NES1]